MGPEAIARIPGVGFDINTNTLSKDWIDATLSITPDSNLD
jgi:hypothetical protein